MQEGRSKRIADCRDVCEEDIWWQRGSVVVESLCSSPSPGSSLQCPSPSQVQVIKKKSESSPSRVHYSYESSPSRVPIDPHRVRVESESESSPSQH